MLRAINRAAISQSRYIGCASLCSQSNPSTDTTRKKTEKAAKGKWEEQTSSAPSIGSLVMLAIVRCTVITGVGQMGLSFLEYGVNGVALFAENVAIPTIKSAVKWKADPRWEAQDASQEED